MQNLLEPLDTAEMKELDSIIAPLETDDFLLVLRYLGWSSDALAARSILFPIVLRRASPTVSVLSYIFQT